MALREEIIVKRRTFILMKKEDLTVKVPHIAQTVLSKFKELLQRDLPGQLYALYVVGSTALGAFVENKSDIDFIAVFNDVPCPADIPRLKRIHARMSAMFRRVSLEGCYLTSGQVGKSSDEIGEFLFYSKGKVCYGRNFGNASTVTWFVLKKYSLTVYGPPPAQFGIKVPDCRLTSYVHENLNTYWVIWVRNMKSRGSLFRFTGLFGAKIEWGVLGISRLFYTLMEKDVASKITAGEYALAKIPAQYAPIIREALRIRNGSPERLIRSPWKRRKEAVRFMEFMIRECNATYESFSFDKTTGNHCY